MAGRTLFLLLCNTTSALAEVSKEIKHDIQNILRPIDAPFINALSEQLYLRCYHQLFSNEPEKIPDHSVLAF